jgi:hypothetical protein
MNSSDNPSKLDAPAHLNRVSPELNDAFVTRALSASALARETNQYIPLATVLAKLDELISAAQPTC